MKIVVYILTILLQLLSIISLKLLDNFYLILTIIFACLILGLVFKTDKRLNATLKAVGWGLLYGSITSITGGAIFMVWLVLNYPG